MDITTLENWLWEAACSIRGPLDAPKYKDYILPLIFTNQPMADRMGAAFFSGENI